MSESLSSCGPLAHDLDPGLKCDPEKHLSRWLIAILVLIFGMIVLGGLTRLTGSGLSMVTWKPLTGFIPPLNDYDWQVLFQQYQMSPEFLKVNFDMTLGDFKNIFWLEFIHRVLGRVIGLVFLAPLILCLKHKFLRRRFGARLVCTWILGGLQGIVGWYMVKSGLVDNPAVSHYRLATHLLLAFATFSLVFWTYLDVRLSPDAPALRQPHIPGALLYTTLGVAILTIFYGALVAGLKAGLVYNTFPSMNGAWIPDEVFHHTFGWKSFFETPGIVQWTHRCCAMVTVLCVIFLWGYSKAAQGLLKRALYLMFGVCLMQMSLGIMTLVMQVPTFLGVLHQAGSLITLSSLLGVAYCRRLSRGQCPNTR